MVLNYKRPDNVNKIIAAYKDKFPITVINIWKDGYAVMSIMNLIN